MQAETTRVINCGNAGVVVRQGLQKSYLSPVLFLKKTQSCGCLQKEKARLPKPAVGKAMIERNTTHGMTHTPEYAIYRGMIQRCTNPRRCAYKRYGGAGVKVCRRWLGPKGFVNFVKDVGKRPSPKHSLGRYLDLGDYKPGNARWMTPREQAIENWKKRRLLRGER